MRSKPDDGEEVVKNPTAAMPKRSSFVPAQEMQLQGLAFFQDLYLQSSAERFGAWIVLCAGHMQTGGLPFSSTSLVVFVSGNVWKLGSYCECMFTPGRF